MSVEAPPMDFRTLREIRWCIVRFATDWHVDDRARQPSKTMHSKEPAILRSGAQRFRARHCIVDEPICFPNVPRNTWPSDQRQIPRARYFVAKCPIDSNEMLSKENIVLLIMLLPIVFSRIVRGVYWSLLSTNGRGSRMSGDFCACDIFLIHTLFLLHVDHRHLFMDRLRD